MLRNTHLRELWSDFVTWAISRGDASKVLTGLQRYADALTRIDLAVPETNRIAVQDIADTLATDELRRLGIFGMFLAEQGLVPTSRQVRRDASDQRRIDQTLADIGQKPWAKDIRAYVRHLGERPTPLKPSTIRVYVRAAVQLLEHAGVASVDDLASEHVTMFLRSRPGHRASLHAWLAFANATALHSIGIARRRSPSANTLAKTTDQVAELIAVISRSKLVHVRAALTAKLLATLYGVTVSEILSLERGCVECRGHMVRIKIRGEWLRIEEPVAGYLQEIVAASTDSESARLFPGRLPGDRLSADTVRYHIRAHLAP